MRRFPLLIICLFALSGTAVWAQESAPPAEDAADAAEPADAAEAEEAEETEELDDSDLDLQTYEQDDDDFVPTEEIPADEPIPFPTDI